MNLWGRKCSPRPTPPPSWLLPEMFISKLNFCCKNEVETESIVHDNISLCGKVFYPCQDIAKLKKKKKNYCFWKMREREIKLKALPQQWVEAKEGLTLTAG